MRSFPLLFSLLAACIDWNRDETLDDLVEAFQESEGITDARDCGAIDLAECDAEDSALEEANTCFADALAACEPATVAISRDGGQEVLVIYPEGGEGCAVRRFSTVADGGTQDVVEESCEGALLPTDTCEAPEADSCVVVNGCDDGSDCG